MMRRRSSGYEGTRDDVASQAAKGRGPALDCLPDPPCIQTILDYTELQPNAGIRGGKAKSYGNPCKAKFGL